jgi:hypothetical protein
MIKKRGIYIAIGGVVMIVVAFAITTSIMTDQGFDRDGFSLPDVLEGMFDQVSDETQLAPGETAYFSFDASADTKMLFWGVQILDYQSGDSVLVSISNIYGDDFGQFTVDQPAFFETMETENYNSYNFNVENRAGRTITIVMMFTKNPQDSNVFSDPNSPLSKTLVPLAISGALLIIGVIAVIAGVIIIIIDYKKRRSEFV